MSELHIRKKNNQRDISYSMVLRIIRGILIFLRAMSKVSMRIICIKNHLIRDLLFHYKKILLFWLLCSGQSAEIHPALSVRQYMAHANDINNAESQ